MFYNSRPVFERENVLKSELLQESADYAREMFQQVYRDYSDGIIEGVQLEVTQSYILVHPGIIKHKGIIYHTKDTDRIAYEGTGKKMYLKLRFHDEVKEESHTIRAAELILDDDGSEFPYDMELGRFTLEKGATLRSNYRNLADMATPHNTLNIQHVPYAGRGGITISPDITYRFAKEMFAGNTNNVYDIAFGMECMSKTVISREVICLYLQKRLGNGNYETYSNEQIYQALVQILRQPNGDAPQREMRPPFPRRKVIVE